MVFKKLIFWLRKKYRMVRAFFLFSFGWFVYHLTRETPPSSYQALIYLFCATSGKFNEIMSALISLRSPPIFRGSVCGVLGTLDKDSVDAKTEELRYRGYLLFPAILPITQCDQLMQFAMTTTCRPRPMDGELAGGNFLKRNFDPGNPLAVRYDYDTQDLLDCRQVQSLLSDETFLAIARSYLKATPKADILSMWWHTNFCSKPDSEAAQYYHFDMDRIKWLKIFIYLTDVGPQDGAHSFIAESHRFRGIPSKFLQRGYVRLSDSEVMEYYGKEREVKFIAPRGSIIIEDTRGLHKGNIVEPTGSSRLLLQLQFSNSLFGAKTPAAKIRRIIDPNFKASLEKTPGIYRHYT
jgi:hypothetical protein